MNLAHHELYSPAIGTAGTVAVFGHYGRAVLAFPSEAGKAYDWRDNGMVGAIADLIDAGRVKLYCVDSFDAASWSNRQLSLEERAREHGRYESWIFDQVVPFIQNDTGGEILTTGASLGAYHAANFALKRADLFPLADLPVGQLRPLDLERVGRARRADLLQQPDRLRRAPRRRPPGVAAVAVEPPAGLRPGAVGGHDRVAAVHAAAGRDARREGNPPRARPVGVRRPPRLALLARAARPPSPEVLLMSDASHLIGLLLGTEEDWPRAFETLLSRVGPVKHNGATHHVTLRADHDRAVRPARQAALRPRRGPARVVVLRAARVAQEGRADGRRVPPELAVHVPGDGEARGLLRDDAARVSRCRETVLIPHKNPPENTRFEYTAAKYNQPFDLARDRGATSATRCS